MLLDVYLHAIYNRMTSSLHSVSELCSYSVVILGGMATDSVPVNTTFDNN